MPYALALAIAWAAFTKLIAMIVPEIIQQMATKIANLGYISQSGAIVQEVERGGKFDIQAKTYKDGFAKAVNISPDAKEGGITFFQVGPTRVLNSNTWLDSMENELTLTGWLNGNRLTEVEAAEMGILTALRNFRYAMPTGSPVRQLVVEFAGDNEGQPIGDRWGWTAPEFQYGKLPYRLFQLRFKLTYFVARGCSPVASAVLKPAC